MSLTWGLLAVLAVAIAASFAARAARRALAAGLIGEINESLTLLENHDLEAALALCADGGQAPSLPTLPTLSYRSDTALMALLGAHLARLSASFYASAEALQDELRGLSSETTETARTERVKSASQALQRTFALGDETLRSLRDIISRRRCGSISRS